MALLFAIIAPGPIIAPITSMAHGFLLYAIIAPIIRYYSLLLFAIIIHYFSYYSLLWHDVGTRKMGMCRQQFLTQSWKNGWLVSKKNACSTASTGRWILSSPARWATTLSCIFLVSTACSQAYWCCSVSSACSLAMTSLYVICCRIVSDRADISCCCSERGVAENKGLLHFKQLQCCQESGLILPDYATASGMIHRIQRH